MKNYLPEEYKPIYDKVAGLETPPATIEENTELTLTDGNKAYGYARYYGAVGGDTVINANASVKVLGQTLGGSAQDVSLTRKGDSNVTVTGGSVIGGVGASAAIGVGNVAVDAEVISISASIKTGGSTVVTLDGKVNTVISDNANVVGWSNGGAALGIGSTAASTVTGNTALTIDGTNKELQTGNFEKPSGDLIPPLTTALNVMKGSGVNAIGVTGGGTAVTTLGGEATSEVGGTTAIHINNATVLGAAGGGLAASVDAAGAGSALLGRVIGNNDGTSDTELMKNVTLAVTNANHGGTAASTTGDTSIEVTGTSTAVGLIGGGVAAASQTYQWRDHDATNSDANYAVGDTYGTSNAAATTGKAAITINLEGTPNKAGISSAISGLIGGIKNDTTQATALTGLANQSAVLGIMGGGLAIGQGSDGAVKGDQGATALATTDGADISLVKGYSAGVFGGGAAVTLNNGSAISRMTDEVTITTGTDMETVGLFGGGLALSMESGTTKDPGSVDDTLAQSTVGTVNITNQGTTDGIFGGGMAIGNSNRSVNDNNAVASVETANITIAGGEVNTLNLKPLMDATKNDNNDTYPWWSSLGYNASGAMADLKGITDSTAIAGGGLGLGMTGSATVGTANITVSGGTVNGDILGGGIAVDNMKEGSGAKVTTAKITVTGGAITGSIYAGGAENGTTLGTKDLPEVEGHTGYDTTNTASTVDTATVTLNGADVAGEISGQGYTMTTTYGKDGNFNPYYDGNSLSYEKAIKENVKDSTLILKGENTLAALDNTSKTYTSDSKIHDFTNVNVAAGSVTKLDGSIKEGDPALISGGTVTVDGTAKLDISALEAKEGNTYLVASDTTTDSTFWTNANLVYDRLTNYAVGTDAEGQYKISYEDINASNVDQASADFAGAIGAGPLQPVIAEGMVSKWEGNDGAKAFFQDWNAAGADSAYQKAALIGEDSAVTGNTVAVAGLFTDSVFQRLSFSEDPVAQPGVASEKGAIWAKYVHNKYEVSGMGSSFGGISASTDFDGAVIGVDLQKTGRFQSGVAFLYGSGDGSGSITKNDYDAWGLTYYGSVKDEAAGTNLMFDVGYTKSSNDITGHIADKKISADRDVDVLSLGVRGEKEYVRGTAQFVPYVGLRYLHVDGGDYSLSYDGQTALRYDAENQNIWMLPIGVSLRNESTLASGWRITPKLDLAYIWAFGDTDTTVDTFLANGSAAAPLAYTVMDDGSWLTALGVEATNGIWGYGAGYSYQKGDDTKNKKWYVNVSYAF